MVAKVRVSSFEFKTRVSSIKNGRIRCFLLIQLKLETRVLILETRILKLENRVLTRNSILDTRFNGTLVERHAVAANASKIV